MSKSFSMFIPIKPTATPRAKITTRGGFGRGYYPKKYTQYMDTIALLVKSEMNKQGVEMIPEGEIVSIGLIFSLNRPKSHYRTGKYSMERKEVSPKGHVKKPDLDNLIKGVLDSLNGFLFHDDSQIVQISAFKKYSNIEGITISSLRSHPLTRRSDD